jgi:nitroreductase
MTERTTDTQLDPLFLERWSPRAYDGSKLSQDELRTLFDAARWAPSAYNHQPWTLLYAEHGDANWDRFLSVLVPFNQSWAKDAGVLIFFVSKTHMGDSANHTHSFDTGAAWMSLALQATKLGLQAHGMSGVDFDAAAKELGVPEGYRVDAAAVVGRQGDVSKLPEQLQQRENKAASPRKPIDEIAFAGNFPG